MTYFKSATTGFFNRENMAKRSIADGGSNTGHKQRIILLHVIPYFGDECLEGKEKAEALD